jgi:hypothetical protein
MSRLPSPDCLRIGLPASGLTSNRRPCSAVRPSSPSCDS